MSVDEKPKHSHATALLIDHTVLRPEASEADIARACAEARRYGFASVCVNPYWVRFAAGALSGSSTNVCAAVGFPLGASEPDIKVAETERALADGAAEIDMVQNIGALRSGNRDLVSKEIRRIAEVAHAHGGILKVILETCLLTDDEKIEVCKLAAAAGADFVKTSTGFSKSGATVEDVMLLRRSVGDSVGVKAAGGIRTLAVLQRMISAGANRIGTSASVQIMRELEGEFPAEEQNPLPSARVPGGHPDTY